MRDIVTFQNEYESSNAIPEDNFEGVDHYNILYRTCDCLVNPRLLNTGWSHEQAVEYLKQAHPYFAYVLDKEPETFKHLYKFHSDIYRKLES